MSAGQPGSWRPSGVPIPNRFNLPGDGPGIPEAALPATPYGPSWRRTRQAYLAGAAALAVLMAAWARGQWLGLEATRVFVDVATTLAALAAATLSLVRTTWLPGERRLAWLLLGAAALAWGLGNVAWTYLELWSQRDVPAAEREIPFPSLADAGYVLLLPLAAAALLVMVIGTTQAATRLRTFLDGLLITSALLFASWVVFLEDIVAFAATQTGALAQGLSLIYPIGDIFLLGLLLLVASRSPPQVRRTMAFLGAALLAITIADAGFWYYVARGTYTTGAWTDPGWLIGFLLIGYAALRPIPVVPTDTAPRPGLWLSALPLAPFVVSTGLAVVVQVQRGALPPFLFWNAIVVVGVLALRQFVMVWENLQLRRETEAALERVQEAHRHRTHLLHTITHDLQNPLSPIQIQLRLLEGHGSEDLRRRLGIVGRNVEQIKRLVADLSDVAKLQDRRLVVVRAPMDLADTVRDVADSFRPLAADRGVDLSMETAPELPIDGDAIRLRQVLANLVSNAIKFTPKEGRIIVRGAADATRVVVEVVDTGRGLDRDEAARLFQPFSQVHRPGEAAERGTGLGLFISRGLAEAHNGALTVSSVGHGHGSTFRLELPARAPPATDAQGPVAAGA